MEAKGLLLPLPESVQKVLTQLLGKAVTVKKIPTGQVLADEPGVIADYIFDTGSTGALALCDLGMANFAGAALMLLPPAATISDVKCGKMDDTVIENVGEVLNICSNLFIHDDHPHVRLGAIYSLPGQTPEGVTKLLAKPAARLDIEVNITGYGVGKMALFTS